MVRKVESVFNTKAVCIKRQANNFADDRQQEHVVEQCEHIVFVGEAKCHIAEITRPSCCQQYHEEDNSQSGIRNGDPATNAAILPRLGSIGMSFRMDMASHVGVCCGHLVSCCPRHFALVDEGFSRF